MSAIFTPPTSKSFTDPSFYGQLSPVMNQEAQVTWMNHDTQSHMKSQVAYLERMAMGDGIADDMHDEKVAGIKHDAQGNVITFG